MNITVGKYPLKVKITLFCSTETLKVVGRDTTERRDRRKYCSERVNQVRNVKPFQTVH